MAAIPDVTARHDVVYSVYLVWAETEAPSSTVSILVRWPDAAYEEASAEDLYDSIRPLLQAWVDRYRLGETLGMTGDEDMEADSPATEFKGVLDGVVDVVTDSISNVPTFVGGV